MFKSLALKVLHKIQHKDHKELLSGAFLALMFKGFGLVFGYLFTIVAVRELGVTDFGIFAMAQGLYQVAAMIGRMGFDSSVVKHVSQLSFKQDHARIKEVYNKGLKVVLLAGTVTVLFFFLGADVLATYAFGKENLTGAFQIMALAVLPSIILFYNSGALRGLKKIGHFSALVNFANFFLATILLLILPKFLAIERMLEVVFAIGVTLAALYSFIPWIRHSKFREHRPSSELKTKDLIDTSLPMLFSGTLVTLNGWTDTLILGAMVSEDEVGIFRVLLRVSSVANVVLFAVNSISAPKFAQLKDANDTKGLQRYVTQSTKLIVFSTLPILLLIAVFYGPILSLFGDAFEPELYVWAVVLLCSGQLFNAFCGSGGMLLIMTGHQKANQNIILISFAINIVANLILIPYYGLFGAAFANMIGLVLRNLLYVIYTNKRMQINTIYNPLNHLKKTLSKIP